MPKYDILDAKTYYFGFRMNPFHVDDTKRTGLAITFEMQPVLLGDGHSLVGYELLYRGPRPARWPDVDRVLLNYLSDSPTLATTFFINLSNETLLTCDLAVYVGFDLRANVVFELTETITDAIEYRDVASRINDLTQQGFRFAIDDFGSGLDGLHRYAALDEVAFVKLDRLFLRQAASSHKTRQIVELLVDQWTRTGTVTIAEGIETSLDLQFARDIGVQMLQGYLIDSMHRSTYHGPRLVYNHRAG